MNKFVNFLFRCCKIILYKLSQLFFLIIIFLPISENNLYNCLHNIPLIVKTIISNFLIWMINSKVRVYPYFSNLTRVPSKHSFFKHRKAKMLRKNTKSINPIRNNREHRWIGERSNFWDRNDILGKNWIVRRGFRTTGVNKLWGIKLKNLN